MNADLYTPIQPSRTGEGGGSNYEVMVRLRDGVTWQQADAEINRAWAERAKQFAAEFPHGSNVTFHTVPLQQGQTHELRPQVLALMAAAGFILLIACANLAGLTLVRISRRTPEMATRLALGASAWQLQRQLWLENLILAGVGGLAGIGVGLATVRGLLALLPIGFLPIATVPLGSARARVHAGGCPVDQHLVWHAAGAGGSASGPAPIDCHARADRRRQVASAPGAHCRRSGAHGGAAGRLGTS